MKVQLHWQFKDRTEMKAQRDVSGIEELRTFASETGENHPIPNGARWLFVEEGSDLFVKGETR